MNSPLARSIARAVLAAGVLGSALACSKGGDAARDSSAVPKVAAPEVSATRTACIEDGRWNECVLLDRLVHGGVAPAADSSDTTRVAFLSPPGIHYRIGKSSTLVAFYYGDSIAAIKGWLALDTIRLAPKADTLQPWPARPSAFRAANLIGALFSEKPEQIERVLRVFAGGLPAPAVRK